MRGAILLLLLLLFGACGAAPPPPVASAPTVIPLKLAANQQLAIGTGVTLRYDGLVIEEIAAGPSPAYPAGSGITLTLIVDGLGAPLRRSVSLLSEGYTSKPEAWFDRYRVTVTDVASPHRDAVIELHVEEVTDNAGTPTVVNVVKGGSVTLGTAEMIVHGNGSVEYSVPGEERERVEVGTAERWRWRDHQVTVLSRAPSMRLQIARLQLAPVQPL